MRLLIAFAALLILLAPAAQADGNPAVGKRIFGRCHGCHSVDPANDRMVGPNLHGLFGRRAGSLAGFNYSDAMRRAGFVWSEETLHQYVLNPKRVVPDNRMVFPGIRNEEQVEDLVAYLKAATR
jgi:cytochrome c